MKDSRRVAALAALGAVLCLAISCGPTPAGKWQDGAWQGKADGVHGEIDVTVSVARGRIAKIAIDKEQEAAGVGEVALMRIPEEIVKAQSTKVDAVTGASGSSKAVIAAVEDALAKAVKK